MIFLIRDSCILCGCFSLLKLLFFALTISREDHTLTMPTLFSDGQLPWLLFISWFTFSLPYGISTSHLEP